jgi:hypothetical protein
VLASSQATAIPRPDNWFDDHVYHHHADLTTELEDLAADHPRLISLTSIGASVRGRELWTVRITDPGVPAEGKVNIYIDGEHHGNEYLGGELCILLIHHLLEDQDDPDVAWVLANCVVWVTPMLNPDGNARDTRTNANGVDLNRHYPFEHTPSGNHGEVPGVEPEVAGNIAFMESHDLDLYVTMHTGIVRLIHPWGYTYDPCPDQAMFENLAPISEAHGVTYGQASTVLYIVTGSSKDFAYGGLGVPGFTFEVDDQQTNQISRREDIASRLADELALLMDLCLNAGMMTSRLELGDVQASSETRGGGSDITVGAQLLNPTLAAANNTTLVVEVWRDGFLADTHSTVLDVPAGGGNTTTVQFRLDGEGTYTLRTVVEYPRMQVANATTRREVLDVTEVAVEGGLFGGSAAGGMLLLVLVAVGVAAVYWAWQRGWRPGWAVARLTGRVLWRTGG